MSPKNLRDPPKPRQRRRPAHPAAFRSEIIKQIRYSSVQLQIRPIVWPDGLIPRQITSPIPPESTGAASKLPATTTTTTTTTDESTYLCSQWREVKLV